MKPKNKKGFTLIEIIVVLIIIAILAAIAIPALMKYINDAKDKQYIAETRSMYTIFTTFMMQLFAEPEGKEHNLFDPATDLTFQDYPGDDELAVRFEAYAREMLGDKLVDSFMTGIFDDNKSYIKGTVEDGVLEVGYAAPNGKTYIYRPGQMTEIITTP